MIAHRLIRLTKDTIVYGFGAAMTGLVGIVLIPFLTRTFQPSEYGIIELLITIVTLSTVVLSFGFDTALAILFFAQEDETDRQKMLSSATLTVVLISLGVSLLLLPWVKFLTPIFATPETSPWNTVLVLAIIPINLLQGFLLAALRYRFRRRAYLTVIGVNVIFMIGLTIWLVGVRQVGLLGYFLAWFLTLVVSCLTALLALRSQWTWSIHKPFIRRLFVLGLPIIPAGLAGWSLSLIDRFFVKYYSLNDLGYYAVAVKVSSILGLCISALQLAWGPFALSIAKSDEAKRTYSRVLTLFTAAAGWLTVVLTAFTPLIIRILTGINYQSAVPAVGPLLLGQVAYGSFLIVSIGTNVTQKTVHLSWTTGGAAIANIILNFILIPRYGFIGAAVATVISYAFSTIALAVVSQRFYPTPYRWLLISWLWLITILAVTVISYPGWSLPGLGIFGIVIGYTMIVLLSGVMDFRLLWHYFRHKSITNDG